MLDTGEHLRFKTLFQRAFFGVLLVAAQTGQVVALFVICGSIKVRRFGFLLYFFSLTRMVRDTA